MIHTVHVELCTHGKIKLHSGSSKLNGNVIVCINGTWSYICGRGNTVVDNNLATVVCSSIGYSQYGNDYYSVFTCMCTF